MSQFETNARKKLVLFIVDPQNDFHEGGSLGVPGSVQDSHRIAQFIRSHLQEIDEIYVSLDSHHKLHIAHGAFWQDSNGTSPTPFTFIKHEDIERGLWIPRDESNLEWAKSYTKSLEDKGRFILCIWPEHCLIGTQGHCVYPAINEALQEWSARKLQTIQYVFKGENCLTEMYSAISAEVPVGDVGKFNSPLFRHCVNTEKLVVCGQALSHCVNFTVRDIANRLIENGQSPSMIYLLVDASSPVMGFEKAGEDFVRDMKESGVHITTTKEFDQLLSNQA